MREPQKLCDESSFHEALGRFPFAGANVRFGMLLENGAAEKPARILRRNPNSGRILMG